MSNLEPLKGINQAFTAQMSLKNDLQRKYHTLASEYAVDIVEKFKELFPGVGIDKIILREKSGKSLKDKINSLQLERFSKLAVVFADIPDIVKEVERNKYGSHQSLNFKELYPLFAERMDENITPDEESEKSIDEANTLANHYKYCISQVLNNSILTYADALKLFESVEGIFSEPRISKNTKTALARIMYAKIKLGLLPDNYKAISLDKLSELYGSKAREAAIKHATSDTLKDAENLDYLNLDEITPIEQDKYDMSLALYNNDHTSKLDRLLDEQEFLHAKDLQGMQIIITSVPRDFETDNIKLKELIKKRNREQDAIEIFNKSYSDLSTLERAYLVYLNSDLSGQKNKPNSQKELDTSPETMKLVRSVIEELRSSTKNPLSAWRYDIAMDELNKELKFESGDVKDFPSYTKLDQECIAEISREFSDYMEHQSAKWLHDHNDSLLVRDSFKHKNKPNGYVAEHLKIEMEGNPYYTLEVQLKSKYVEAKCKPGQSASHAARIGKQRITPTLLDDPYFSTALLDEELRTTYMKRFPRENNALYQFMRELDFILPKYTVIEEDRTSQKAIATDLTTIENATLFYDDIMIHDHTTAQRILQLIQIAEQNELTISTSPKNGPQYTPFYTKNEGPSGPEL